MNLKNKYQKFSKITEPKFRRILRLFALDLTASDTAKLTGVSIRSVNSLYLKLRRRLADECGRQAPLYGICLNRRCIEKCKASYCQHFALLINA